MELSSINLLAKDLSSTLYSGIEREFDSIERKMHLDQMPSLQATPIVGAVHWEAFEQRRVLELVYASAATEYWEVRETTFRRGGPEPRKAIRCRPLWGRLDDQVAYVTLTDGTKITDLTNTAVDVGNALSRVLSADWNAPALFAAGTVATALQGTDVFTFESAGTHRDHLDAIAADLNAEWEARWDAVAGEYKIDLVERIGDPDATVRTIRETQSAAGEIVNRLSMNGRMRSDGFFSSIMPLCGKGGDTTLTMDSARWPITSSTYDSTADETTVTLAEDPIWADGVLLDTQVVKGADGAVPHAVVSSTAPDTIVVSGDVAAWNALSFVDANGDDLITLTDPGAVSSFGEVTRTKRFSNVAPYDNLLDRAGVDTEAASLTGWAAIGTGTTLSTVTDPDYARTGAASIKVETTTANEEEGIRTSTFALAPEYMGQVLSVHVNVRAETGRMQVQLVDSNGEEYPPDEVIEGGEDAVLGYTIQGAKPAAGDIFIKVTKLEDSSVFYIDNASVVASSKSVGYAPYMGARGLWLRGMEYLLRNGGTPERSFNGEAIDLNVLDGTGQELTLGDGATVELHNGTTLEARITSTKKTLSPGEPSTTVSVRLDEPIDDALERFFDRPDGADRSERTGGTPRVQPVIEVQDRYQSGDTGYLEFTVRDPLGIVDAVETRTKTGANFDEGDAYASISPDGSGVYTETVGLVEKHNSFIEVRLVAGVGVDDVYEAWEFDVDLIPEADYSVEWSWNSTRSTVEATVIAQGDEDVASYRLAIDTNQDGTDENVVTVDGRSTTSVVNPTEALSPGDTVDISAIAYTGTGQSGTPEPVAQQLDETFDVPNLEPARTKVRPSMEADAFEDANGKGHLTFTVDDPDGLVTGVETREASGRNLKSGDSFGAPEVSATSPYEETVDLVDGHVSYIEARLVTVSGVKNVRTVFTYDPDTDPEADYALEWHWDSADGTPALRIVATGDDDVGSFQFTADYNRDGTTDRTHNVDATATTQRINTTETLTAGQLIDVTATAYSEAGQSGTVQDHPLNETVEVPALRDELAKEVPSLTAVSLDQFDDSGTEKGRVVFDVDDPDDLLTQVDVRKAVGRNLYSGDSFSQLTDDGTGTYTSTVALSETHNSYIELALRVGGDREDVYREFAFDADQIPEASYSVEWRWNSTRATIEASVIAKGDEDVESYEMGIDPDQDGTFEDVVTVNGRSTTTVVNPNIDLTPGDTVDITAVAHSDTVANHGTASDTVEPVAQQLDETFDVPELSDTIPLVKPSIDGTAEQQNGSADVVFTVDDPDGVVSSVEARRAEGRNLVSGDSYETTGTAAWFSESSGTYTASVGLAEKHNSYIEVKLTTSASGMDDYLEVFAIDPDTTPEARYEIEWNYDSTLDAMQATIIARGDDDVESYEFSITDGTNTDTHTVDGRNVRQDLNVNFGLSPAETVTITATAHSDTVANHGTSSDTTEPNGLNESYVVLAAIDGTVGGGQVLIKGKHILLDGNVTVDGTFTLADGEIAKWTINASRLIHNNIYIGDNLSGVNAAGNALIGNWNAGSSPVVKVLGHTSDTYVFMFTDGAQSTTMFEVAYEGNVVFSVDGAGASMGNQDIVDTVTIQTPNNVDAVRLDATTSFSPLPSRSTAESNTTTVTSTSVTRRLDTGTNDYKSHQCQFDIENPRTSAQAIECLVFDSSGNLLQSKLEELAAGATATVRVDHNPNGSNYVDVEVRSADDPTYDVTVNAVYEHWWDSFVEVNARGILAAMRSTYPAFQVIDGTVRIGARLQMKDAELVNESDELYWRRPNGVRTKLS